MTRETRTILFILAVCSLVLIGLLSGCTMRVCRHEAVANCLALQEEGYEVRLNICPTYEPIWGSHMPCQARIGDSWRDFDATMGIVHLTPMASIWEVPGGKCQSILIEDYIWQSRHIKTGRANQ